MMMPKTDKSIVLVAAIGGTLLAAQNASAWGGPGFGGAPYGNGGPGYGAPPVAAGALAPATIR